MSVASILHADLDAFFASVEQRDDPALRGRPVLVGGGVVLAASYEARRFGVRSAMGGARARRLCPEAIVVAPRFSAYVEASKAVFAIFADTAPVVEAVSIDEAFLDVRGLEHVSGTAGEIAVRLRRRVAEEVGLPLSVGVASTKHLAKVASNAAKPNGLRIVAAGREAEFLHPLPVGALWGVGPATEGRLHGAGIRTVGQLAALDEAAAVDLLGRAAGRQLHAIAHNRDPRRVRSGRSRRSIGSQSALGSSRARSPEELESIVAGLVDRVSRRARRADRVGRTVVLRLRFGDFTRATRSRTLRRPTAATAPILEALRALLHAERDLIRRRGLTLVGVTLTNLERADAVGVQLELPLEEGAHTAALDAATDAIRDRFGTSALQRAALLGRGERASAWLMPGDGPDGLPERAPGDAIGPRSGRS